MFGLVLTYLLACTAASVFAVSRTVGNVAAGNADYVTTMTACAAVGSVGGCLYCLRAVYLNKAVHKRWDSDWNIWYFLRPLTSTISGGVSYIFLKAGLILLEAGTKNNATHIGYFALAFVAGLNVDKFVARIEDLAESAWGIEKSRARQTPEATKRKSTQSSS